MAVITRTERKKEGEKLPTRHFSNLQEKSVAKALNGKQTKNSGATMFQKGDVLLEDWLLECKTCEKHKESFAIRKEWIEKNKKESLLTGSKYEAVVFNFGPGEENYYVIDEATFKYLINK